MTSYLRKYVTALASAKDYVAQWSSDHVYANEELIVPFPTIAIFDPDKHVWTVHIKAWIYLPFQPKSFTNILPSLPTSLPSLPSFLGRNKKDDNKTEEFVDAKDKPTENEQTDDDKNKLTKESEPTDNVKVDQDKKDAIAKVNKENNEEKKADGSSSEASGSDDDIYEDALQEEFGTLEENPGRLALFFVGSSVKIATKSIINGVEHLLQPSDESGFIEQNLELPDDEVISLCTRTHTDCKDKKFEYKIQVNNTEKSEIKKEETDDYKSFNCTIYVLARHGISVISDIDDTIKISNVLSKRSLLKHTFYSYFKPVDGISELYRKWNEQKCQFHYVSASPWQLYPALRCFLEKYKFPLGTVNLRKFSWSLKFLHPPDTYKNEAISTIIDAYPSRKYICVGDSGELDPEIYSKLFTKYPQSIAHIFIRDVCKTPECSPTCEERYKKAFEDVPKERWTVFKDAKDIETDISKLVSV